MRSRLEIALDVLHTGTEAALATHSAAMAGYPFVTSVPYALDERHRPMLLLSGLAEHTRNLAADRRASMMIRAVGSGGDVARVTLVGTVTPFAAPPELVRRYLRYQPEAERFLQLGDFSFYRMDIERIRTIGGFGQAGWLEGQRLLDLPWFEPREEEAALAAVAAEQPADFRLRGVDLAGIDGVRQGEPLRLAFEPAVLAPVEVGGRLRALLAAIDNFGSEA